MIKAINKMSRFSKQSIQCSNNQNIQKNVRILKAFDKSSNNQSIQ
jgi:hypothetical protein